MTTEDVPLNFIELQHELQEFGGRVIAVEIRSDTGELIAKWKANTRACARAGGHLHGAR